MIVRNEAAVLERCLDSARPVVGAVSLCDTGSTDGTPAFAEAWMAANGIPGRVHRAAFEGFGASRTRSILAAQETLKDLGWDLSRSYLLFLDADMVLEVGEGFRPEDLRADVCSVVQRNGNLSYPNVRLSRASLPARFVGATHEYFETPDGATSARLEALSIDDRNDGGSRGDKYERDRRLLEEELARDPGSTRAMFYLAQTLRGLGERAKALFWYRRRIAAGGWPEEVWYSHYATGQVFAEAGQAAEAVRAFHAALRLDPSRAEPLLHVVRLLRDRGWHRAARKLAQRGLGVPVPVDRTLFVEPGAYVWPFLSELAIASYYTPHRSEGLDANERVFLGKGAPRNYSHLASRNAAFYARPLEGATFARIVPALEPPYAPCNPSILRTAEGYLVCCRAVSYRIDGWQRYRSMEPDGVHRTRNLLLRLDRDLGFLGQTEVHDDDGVLRPLREHAVRGLEDGRLVLLDGETAFTCTTTEHHPAGPHRISLLTVDGAGGLVRHVPLTGHGDERPQKNWLPFLDETSGELRAVYGYEPLEVLRIDPETGQCTVAVSRPTGRNLEAFRGSAGPVKIPAELGGGRLLLVHHVADHGRRTYYQRFLRVDEEWNLRDASRPFTFMKREIEFPAGACLSHSGEELLVTFGVEDREAWLCRIPLATVLGILRPLP